MPASTLVAGEDGASEAVVEGGTAVATVPEAVAAREEAKKAGGDGRSYCVAISRDLHVRDRRQNTATSDKIGHAQSNYLPVRNGCTCKYADGDSAVMDPTLLAAGGTDRETGTEASGMAGREQLSRTDDPPKG